MVCNHPAILALTSACGSAAVASKALKVKKAKGPTGSAVLTGA